MINPILNILSTYITLRQQDNNKKIYIATNCPFCGHNSKRIFRYNTKLKVAKFYCCGKSFKDYTQLLHELKYLQWHKDKLSMNYSRFEKSKIVYSGNLDLPF